MTEDRLQYWIGQYEARRVYFGSTNAAFVRAMAEALREARAVARQILEESDDEGQPSCVHSWADEWREKHPWLKESEK